MKNFLLSFIIIVSGVNAFSQTIAITGAVKDDQGQHVPLVFIRDAQHFYATYADSSGAFRIKADPSSTLIAIAAGYADTKVKIDGKSTINIVMAKGNSSSANGASSTAGATNAGAAAAFSNKEPLVNQSGSSTAVKAGFNQEPTKGSPYLFANWVHGFAVGAGDSLLYDINNLYNYDKTSGDLLYTQDLKRIMQVNKQAIKYFCLFNGKLYPQIFESAPAVSSKPFTEVLLSTSRYKIYKQTDTKLIRADFHTDGVIESGHRYDEYDDAVHYYFVRLPGDKPKQISLKKKTLKELMAGDADKFISAQGDRDVDEDYVRDLAFSL
ncbi:hypothetical protein [Mucilaginibacter xinganensis]|uniref:CarboxypepD_reg-like domain-containing protein n=1 Tax=Mucilaginibacter xinganensis TaxID=1234841 RepID=A0A223NRQ3_9SPHI|nr:hypothetical protein [Mucilaginibacter xinganensis]ASU32543.1 hypothetical protein MuYL_0640 [Mucilaginibacter xinganensis]